MPAGRYYTAQIVDEWAEMSHNINERNFPEHPHGLYAICLAGSTPDMPDGCVRVDIPSPRAKLLTRVELGDDVEGAVSLQHQFSLSSTGPPDVTRPVPLPDFDNAHLPGGWVFEREFLTLLWPPPTHVVVGLIFSRWCAGSATGSPRTPAT